jgi:predicted DsbA family dithiol-disulfide isomerase
MYNLELNPSPYGLDSRPALIGAKYAEAAGRGDEYHRAVFRAYWLQAQSIEDRSNLLAIAQSIGLPPDAFSAALDQPEYEAAVEADIMQAYRYGLNGVPALVFASKYLVSGAQPYEVLREVVEKVEAEGLDQA